MCNNFIYLLPGLVCLQFSNLYKCCIACWDITRLFDGRLLILTKLSFMWRMKARLSIAQTYRIKLFDQCAHAQLCVIYFCHDARGVYEFSDVYIRVRLYSCVCVCVCACFIENLNSYFSWCVRYNNNGINNVEVVAEVTGQSVMMCNTIDFPISSAPTLYFSKKYNEREWLIDETQLFKKKTRKMFTKE